MATIEQVRKTQEQIAAQLEPQLPEIEASASAPAPEPPQTPLGGLRQQRFDLPPMSQAALSFLRRVYANPHLRAMVRDLANR